MADKQTNKQPINVADLPAGLSKRELLKQPALKSVNSWFTWAGIVQIGTGILNFATVGQLAQLQAQGYAVNEGYMFMIAAVSIAFIVLGILLLVKRSTILAYIVGGSAILWAIVALASGGSVGAGIIAAVLAIVGARKLEKVWQEYQAVQQGAVNL